LGFGSLSPLMGRDGGAKKLVSLYKKFPQRIARHLHLSLQSGSDQVLRLMKRGYRADEYYQLARQLRSEIPGLNLTTDVIVGFPGEREKDFAKTIKLVEKVGFGKIHIFRYSPRPGTLAQAKAAEWGEVPEAIKKERAKRLAMVEERLRKRFWRSLRGKEAWALVHPGRKIASLYAGQTDNFVPVLIKNVKPDRVGRLVRLRLGKVSSVMSRGVKGVPLTE